MKKNSYLFRLVRNRKILREKEKKQREPIVRPIFDRREIVSAISIWTFNYRKSARNEVMAVGGGKNLGNANAGRTENETRPSFPGLNIRAYTIAERILLCVALDLHDDRLRIPISFSKIEERIGSSLLDRFYSDICLCGWYRWMRCYASTYLIGRSEKGTIRWRFLPCCFRDDFDLSVA